jgi:peptidylprolyl isomerase
MKILALIAMSCIALSLSACGDDSSSGATQPPDPTAVTWKRGEPSIAGAHGSPPPKKLIVKDLRVGSGAALEKGRTATLKYKNFDYRTGQNYEDWWDRPFVTGFGKGESLGAWETGLKGMRVGGRRELVVPAKQAYGNVAQIYVLELQAVE